MTRMDGTAHGIGGTIRGSATRGLALLPLAGCIGVAAAAGFGFEQAIESPVGNPQATAVGDIDGDGRDDVVLALEAFENGMDPYFYLFVYRQMANGELAPPDKYAHSQFNGLVGLALADADGDGVLDVAMSHNTGFTFYTGGADGELDRRDLAGPRNCKGLVTVDADLDGITDYVCKNVDEYDPRTILLYGDGEGTYGVSVDLPAFGPYARMEAGDVTNDGIVDLVVFEADASFRVFPGNGTGFDAPVAYPTPGYAVGGIAIGDFNGDQRNDLAAAISSNSPIASISFYYQDDAGGFEAPVRVASYDIPNALDAADLDGNGETDLLVGHQGWHRIGRYLQHDGVLAAERLTHAPPNIDPDNLFARDVDSDGCNDAVAGYSGGLVVLKGNCRAMASDFDGDGHADILWRNAADGRNVSWSSAQRSDLQDIGRVRDLAWQAVGVGDFDGDRHADILWRHAIDGRNTIWRSGDGATQQRITRVRNSDWIVAGVGDFAGDGADDIYWRNTGSGSNALWPDGLSTTQPEVQKVHSQDWQIVGVGDFDGDEEDDLLWRNLRTGNNAIWRSADHNATHPIGSVGNLDWTVAGTDDFDGDGRDDILWRNSTTARNAIWRGGDSRDLQPIAAFHLAWEVAATGDYDGDGRADIVWRNQSNGRNMIWKGGSHTDQLPITDITNMDWQIKP